MDLWIAASLNVLLNILLIPSLGIDGAAIASASALGLTNILRSILLYRLCKIHPFTGNYLKPIIASIIIIFAMYAILSQYLTDVSAWVILPAMFILCILIYGVTLILTKSFDHEDMTLLISIGSKMGINMRLAESILKRFSE